MQRDSKREYQLTIVLTFTGSLPDAYDAARRVLDDGTLQNAMHDHYSAVEGFTITNAEVK